LQKFAWFRVVFNGWTSNLHATARSAVLAGKVHARSLKRMRSRVLLLFFWGVTVLLGAFEPRHSGVLKQQRMGQSFLMHNYDGLHVVWGRV